MSEIRVLIVEDDQPIRDMIAWGLTRAGFSVHEAPSVEAAKRLIARESVDLLLVDWGLPDAGGLELVRSLKADPATRRLPLMMLTARSAESDKVSGLDSGADDYLTKPFSMRELIARINAVLRRTSDQMRARRIVFDRLSLDQDSQRVEVAGILIHLSALEYRLLEHLLTHPERLYTRAQLVDQLWGPNADIDGRTVDVHVARLRKALEASGCADLIQTVRGSGYRFSARPGDTPK